MAFASLRFHFEPKLTSISQTIGKEPEGMSDLRGKKTIFVSQKHFFANGVTNVIIPFA